MIDLPRIAIVTPSFNQAAFLEATIRSVIDQEYPDLEYIVMNGGSTDGSADIIQGYADRLTHWESRRDNGQADAVYRGFEHSTGEILGYLNSDDILLPGSLRRVGRYFATHPSEEWVVGGTVQIGPAGETLRDPRGRPLCNLGTRVTFRNLLFFGCAFNQCACFWRRDAFWAVGGFDRSLRYSFDYDLFLRLARRRPSGQIKEFLAGFRLHPASKTSTLLETRNAENEILWKKYGRYQKSQWRRGVAAFWYTRGVRLQSRVMRIKLALGLLRCPAPVIRHQRSA